MAKYYIRRQDGRAYTVFGWTPDVQAGLHYMTEKDAQGALDQMPGVTDCTIERVPPKLDAGNTRLASPIFSGARHD